MNDRFEGRAWVAALDGIFEWEKCNASENAIGVGGLPWKLSLLA
jgi:hypothetical protein